MTAKVSKETELSNTTIMTAAVGEIEFLMSTKFSTTCMSSNVCRRGYFPRWTLTLMYAGRLMATFVPTTPEQVMRPCLYSIFFTHLEQVVVLNQYTPEAKQSSSNLCLHSLVVVIKIVFMHTMQAKAVSWWQEEFGYPFIFEYVIS